jgi:hypothetical protein
VIEHRTAIAHIKPAAARFTFLKMLGFVGRLHADALADDGAARNFRHHSSPSILAA